MSVVSNALESSSSRPPRSLNRQTVLEEDEYTEALSHIIARDFFPSIAHLDATNDYLDALRSDDPLLINASVRRLEDLNTPITRMSARTWGTPSQTPYRMGPLETPLRTPQEAEPPTKRARYDIDMSLDTFQARYTSEDNSSFTEILEDENRKRKEKYSWAWEAQKRVEAQRDRMLEARERLLIEPPPGVGVREKFVIEAPEVRGMITASGESERATAVEGKDDNVEGGDEDKEKQLAVVPTEGESEGEVDVMAPKKDTRPAGVDGWKFKARNALMFPPDADISPYHPLTSKTTEDLKVAAKIIKYDSTRLPEQDNRPTDSISAPPSPTRSRIDAAIAGTPCRRMAGTSHSSLLYPHLHLQKWVQLRSSNL
ncbi:unnamed protein product [Somion occarium]|uniref:Uncharacterized protein n=1 Tax=Somion occarium TaxID=3059160 RepID=A0ABP1CL24_9APHY